MYLNHITSIIVLPGTVSAARLKPKAIRSSSMTRCFTLLSKWRPGGFSWPIHTDNYHRQHPVSEPSGESTLGPNCQPHVQAVTTAVGLEFGLASSLFAVSLCFTLITMYDAAGVRYHSGAPCTVWQSVIDLRACLKLFTFNTDRLQGRMQSA